MTRKLRTLFVAAGFAVASLGGTGAAMTSTAAAENGAVPAGYYDRYGRYHRGNPYYRRGYYERRRWRRHYRARRNCRPVYRTYWHYGHRHRRFVGYRCFRRYGYGYRYRY